MIGTKERNSRHEEREPSVRHRNHDHAVSRNSCGGCTACHQKTGIRSSQGGLSLGGSDNGDGGLSIQKPCAATFFQRNIGNNYMQSVANNRVPTIQRKCACGGSRASCADKEEEMRKIQPKLTVNSPNDVYEQEADRVADAVMRSADLRSHRSVVSETEGNKSSNEIDADPRITPVVQRRPRLEIGDDEESVHTKERPGQTPTVFNGLEAEIQNLQGSGKPLDQTTRSFFEPCFGHDFSQVGVHADSKANDIASKVKARAFTIGRDMVFAQGEYSPESDSGKRLLAHELTHVVQQRQSGVNRTIFRSPSISVWNFKNTGSTSADNCCALCPRDVGEDCRSADGYFNGMELQAFIKDEEAGATYDIKRTAHAKYWQRVGGSWSMIREWGPGHNDDSHNNDECLTPTIHAYPALPSIYVLDQPGFRSRATPTGVDAAATDAVLMSNFTEFVEITDAAGNGSTDSNSVNWHTVVWSTKINGTWTFSEANSEIDTGHRASVDP